jgi:hypothetical protein
LKCGARSLRQRYRHGITRAASQERGRYARDPVPAPPRSWHPRARPQTALQRAAPARWSRSATRDALFRLRNAEAGAAPRGDPAFQSLRQRRRSEGGARRNSFDVPYLIVRGRMREDDGRGRTPCQEGL